jgi:hypothetical protein
MKKIIMPALDKHAPSFPDDESLVMRWEASKKAQ